MITKIIWALIGLNTLALIILLIAFLASTQNRNVDTMESGWMFILFGAGIVVILLAAIPLLLSQSSFSVGISAFFAALPLIAGLSILAMNNFPSFKKNETMAELYYKDKTQRGIAYAIETGQLTALEALLNGQDLNIQGNRVWDWDGLNYLQFAVRLRSNADPTLDLKKNEDIIRLLVNKGSATTPALPEGIKRLPLKMVALLLENGADPNTKGFVNSDPLLFEAIGQTKRENDIAILLIQKGADVNAKNSDGLTPIMFAANNASTGESWADTWRLIRYLLEEAHADYHYTTSDGNNFTLIIDTIRKKAGQEKVSMSPDFITITEWLDHDSKTDI